MGTGTRNHRPQTGHGHPSGHRHVRSVGDLLRGLVPRRAARFFVLAYALTWAAWLPMLNRPDEWLWMHYAGALGPAAVLLAFGSPFVLFGVGAVVSAGIGHPVALGEFFGSREYPGLGLMVIPIEVFFFGYGEEVGWRGYALDALEETGHSSYTATTVLALFWAGWHLPLFFYDHGLATLTLVLVPGWLLSLLFGGYLTTFLYRSSGDSLLVAAFFHRAVDLVSITPTATTTTLVVVNAGLIAAAVGAVIRYAPTLNAHGRTVQP